MAPARMAIVLVACAALSACGTGQTHTVTAEHSGGAAQNPGSVPPLASAQSSTDQSAQLDVLSLTRSGPTTTLTLRLTHTSQNTSGLQVSVLLSSTNRMYHGAIDETMDAITLIDPVHGQEYTAAKDAQGNCVCTDVSAMFVAPGQPATLSATYGAPPGDVSQMDVFVPHFGTFHDLPISSGAASATSAATGLTPTDLTLETSDLIDNALAIFQSGRQTRIRLSADVLFAFNKANLSPRAGALIAQVAARIRSTPHLTGLRIDGYTDSIGSQSYNIPLSNRRAAAVAAALREALGSTAPQMSVAGHGADSPAAPNTNPGGSDNPAGRALNRRVEVSYAD